MELGKRQKNKRKTSKLVGRTFLLGSFSTEGSVVRPNLWCFGRNKRRPVSAEPSLRFGFIPKVRCFGRNTKNLVRSCTNLARCIFNLNSKKCLKSEKMVILKNPSRPVARNSDFTLARPNPRPENVARPDPKPGKIQPGPSLLLSTIK